MPVVKCDAYGHGLVPVANVLEENGADMLAVDNADHGVTLGLDYFKYSQTDALISHFIV